jgi:hypothetical protein
MKPRPRWIWIGHALTALWIASVVIITRGDPQHVLFDAIFIVPLVGWLLALVIRHFLNKGEGQRDNRP